MNAQFFRANLDASERYTLSVAGSAKHRLAADQSGVDGLFLTGDWIANGRHFSFTQSYPDFDLPALAAYGKERGVRLVGHNETAGAVENYERQLEAGVALYAANGVQVVKTGYVKPNGSIERTLETLRSIQVEGLMTNLAFLRATIAHPGFRDGAVFTGFVERFKPALLAA